MASVTETAKKHCGSCRLTGHSARTCAIAIEAGRTRAKEVLDNLFGKDREKEQEERQYAVRPQILVASKGPRFLADGSYRNPYRWNPIFTMSLDGSVTHTAKAVAHAA